MAIDRRRFLKATAAEAALVGLGSASCARHPGARPSEEGIQFAHGVASGDPLADRVILWTRVSPPATASATPIRTSWWISRDSDGRERVASGRADATPERDFTVKVDVGGLEPATDYFYGFETNAGPSPVGRTRTLPEGRAERARLGVVSCSSYAQGYFNAYGAIARRGDLDVVLHLGDYLYEYEWEGDHPTEIPDRVSDPLHEILTLEDYRLRHAQYKTDPDLQAAHARHPFITVWDDHESANNSSSVGAENHDPSEGPWTARRLAAIRAYQEWMPIRDLPTGLFRIIAFGDLIDLVMLDTRLHARSAIGPNGDHEVAMDPSRTILGEDQTRWLLDALDDSKARGTAWRIIGQQVIVSPMTGGRGWFNADTWDGYRENRRRFLGHLRSEGIENVAILTGDYHSSWAFDVPESIETLAGYEPTNGEGAVAVEFVVPAVSSPPVGNSPEAMERFGQFEGALPHLRYMELENNGFVVLEVERGRIEAEYVHTDPATTRSIATRMAARFEVASRSNHLTRLSD